MRIVNIFVLALLCLGVISAVVNGDPRFANRDAAYVTGQLVGAAIWIGPIVLAAIACGESGSPRVTKIAVRTTMVAGFLLGFLFILLAFTARIHVTDITTILGFGLPTVLFVVNIFVLSRKLERDEPEPQLQYAFGYPRTIPLGDLSGLESAQNQNAQRGDADLHDEDEQAGSYFLRHWRGRLSLPVSFWAGFVLLLGLGNVFAAALIVQVQASDVSLRAFSILSLSYIPIALLGAIWALVGVWRSATRRAIEGGRVWAYVAKAVVILVVLGICWRFRPDVWPNVRETALLALDRDPIGLAKVELIQDGKALALSGEIGLGSAARVREQLDAAPNVQVLVLSSNGGRLREARSIAKAVRDRKLDTYVETQCASACTYIFLAGKDRAATPNAQIGFHQPSFPEMNAAVQAVATRNMLAFYRSMNINEEFLKRVGETPASSMWYPTRQELMAAGIVNRMTLGGEMSLAVRSLATQEAFVELLQKEAVFAAIEHRFPGTIKAAAEAGWRIKLQGGSDSEVSTAARATLVTQIPKVLKSAPDEVLSEFGALMVDELMAARSLGVEACRRFLASQLNISQTLPKDIVQRDKEWTLRAFAATPRSDSTAPDRAQVNASIAVALRDLPPKYARVVSRPGDYSSDPGLTCDAITAFYRAINALPPRDRLVALRGMFQAN